MKRFLIQTATLLACCLLSACYNTGDFGGPATLGSDTESISATAEFVPGESDSTRVVKIKSNRSWYAHLNDIDHPVGPTEEVPWGYLDTKDHFNLTNVEDEVEIKVTFRRNYSEKAVNGTLDFFSEGKKFLSIPISQTGAVYRLNATPDKEEANCDSDRIKIMIDCNTAWTAELLPGATADVSLSKASGFDPDSLIVDFKDNYDPAHKKYASVKITANGGLEKTVNLRQSNAIPYLRISPDSQTKIKPGLGSAAILIQTNCNWTAAVKEGSELSNIVITNPSGSAAVGNQAVNFSFKNPSDDPHISKSATIVISAEGMETPVETTVSQAGTLFLDFYSKSPTFTEFTPAIQSKTSETVCTHSFKTSWGEYTVVNYINYVSTSNGLLYKQYDKNRETGKQYSYFTFPGIEGLTLTEIIFTFKYHSSNHKYTITIKDGNDKAYSAAVAGDIADTADHLSYLELPLGEGEGVEKPEPGVAYRLQASANKNCYIYQMNLIYE